MSHPWQHDRALQDIAEQSELIAIWEHRVRDAVSRRNLARYRQYRAYARGYVRHCIRQLRVARQGGAA